jgi:hypothetical protein
MLSLRTTASAALVFSASLLAASALAVRDASAAVSPVTYSLSGSYGFAQLCEAGSCTNSL